MSLPRPRDNYVVVGGGAAGLILCLRLLEAGSNVTLIERGTEFADAKADTNDPLDWGFAAMGTGGKDDSEASRNLTAPQTQFDGRQIVYPQGSGLGGSTNINACIWTAGHSGVFDSTWPASWNSKQMSQYLNSAKKLSSPALCVAAEGMPRAILTRGANSTFNAAAELCDGTDESKSSAWSEVLTSKYLVTATQKNDASSSANRVLRLQNLIRKHGTTASGGKLLLHCEAEAEFVVFEGTRAVGVHVKLKTGAGFLLKPVGCGEIILCCGVFETPRLLIASGLKGETYRSAACSQFQQQYNADLRKCEKERERDLHGEVVNVEKSAIRNIVRNSRGSEDGNQTSVCLLGIGMNLQDHVVLPVICIGNWWINHKCSSNGECKTQSPRGLLHWLWGLYGSFVELLFSHPSPSSLPPNGVHGWIDLDATGKIFEGGSKGGGFSNKAGSSPYSSPSAQLVFIDGRMAAGITAEMLLPRLSKPHYYSYYLRPFLSGILGFVLRLGIIKWLCSFAFGFLVCLTKPHSRGSLANPKTIMDPISGAMRPQVGPLQADPAYLTDERDVTTLRAAMSTAHALLEESRQRDGLWYLELLPGLTFNYCLAADYFMLYAKLFAAPFYHACGTCKMGDFGVAREDVEALAMNSNLAGSANNGSSKHEELNNNNSISSYQAQAGRRSRKDTSVVDAELRVHGVKGLRIADASIFPAIPSGPIAAVCMAVGEAAASFLIREQQEAGAKSM